MLVGLIKLVQLIKYRILGHSFSRDGIELSKHFLNFYELNLKSRKIIKVKQKYYLGLNIANKNSLRLILINFLLMKVFMSLMVHLPCFSLVNKYMKIQKLN